MGEEDQPRDKVFGEQGPEHLLPSSHFSLQAKIPAMIAEGSIYSQSQWVGSKPQSGRRLKVSTHGETQSVNIVLP